MDKFEKQRIKQAEKIVAKWRKILLLDPIWKIRIEIVPCPDIDPALARVNIGNCEYFSAVVEISDCLIQDAPYEIFEEIMTDVISHELLHIVGGDFSRTATMAAGKNEAISKELRYKFEQSVTRLQKAFVSLDEKLREKEDILDNVRSYFYKERDKDREKIKSLEEEIVKLKEKPKLIKTPKEPSTKGEN